MALVGSSRSDPVVYIGRSRATIAASPSSVNICTGGDCFGCVEMKFNFRVYGHRVTITDSQGGRSTFESDESPRVGENGDKKEKR